MSWLTRKALLKMGFEEISEQDLGLNPDVTEDALTIHALLGEEGGNVMLLADLSWDSVRSGFTISVLDPTGDVDQLVVKPWDLDKFGEDNFIKLVGLIRKGDVKTICDAVFSNSGDGLPGLRNLLKTLEIKRKDVKRVMDEALLPKLKQAIQDTES
jgi:hypothetical protein